VIRSVRITSTEIVVDTQSKEIVLTNGDTIRYFKGTAAPPVGWNSLAFDDNTWEKGPLMIGYGDNYTYGTELSDMSGNYSTVYARRTFLNTFDVIDSVVMVIDYDDGFVAFVNGNEFARANVPDQPTYQSNATVDHESGSSKFEYRGLKLNSQLLKGENVFAFHLLNLSSSDFAFTSDIIVYGKKGKTLVNEKNGIIPGVKNSSSSIKRGQGGYYDLKVRAINVKNNEKLKLLPGGIYLHREDLKKTEVILK